MISCYWMRIGDLIGYHLSTIYQLFITVLFNQVHFEVDNGTSYHFD